MKITYLVYEKIYNLFASDTRKDEILWSTMENVLSYYPHLNQIKPSYWPRRGKTKVTNKEMETFQSKRSVQGHDEGMNLPLILYLIATREDIENVQAFESALGAFDWFAKEMSLKPGGRTVLQPLWTSAWDHSRLWAVLAEVLVARHFADNGFLIEGFERQISNSKKTADIQVSHQGKTIWIDIETHNLKIDSDNINEFRKMVVHRAQKKMKDKFSDLPENEHAFVTPVYRVNNTIAHGLYIKYSEVGDSIPGLSKNVVCKVYWMIRGRSISSDPYAFRLVDKYK
jgi:hypothetical protein